MAEQAVLVGHIRDAFGIQGWIELQPYSDEAAGLLSAKQWQLRRGGQTQSVKVEQAKRHSKRIVAKLAGTADRTAAEGLKGFEVWVDKRDLPPPKENEFYWTDLIGCRVENTQGTLLGEVDAVDDNGAHGFLSVKSASGVQHLIPFVAAYVIKVDVAAKLLIVDWQEDFAL
ncbi:MAG: ribosome maturation factor RimM [Burkholderiaceae bacterium]